MNQTHQNLARSWRPKQFNQIVGQALPVKMLQNSLYTNHFFPVYLFSGQRGCGKTTTARVFAAALNCAQLPEFQKNPKLVLPCGTCASCAMMLSGKHPDFIEMDAASHTGVDNVRSIVDASSFMPLAGQKRVYLIDEAHMLSKAAFNAFLKILEEPPASVLFILATTDPHKIIDTVRSRCFQLFFDPVADETVVGHLKNVCAKEEIAHDESGLHAIVANCEGSIRDALNLLEQVRFSAESVTKDAVLNVLGHVDQQHIDHLYAALIHADAHEVQKILKEINFYTCTPEPLWYALCTTAKNGMWYALGIESIELSPELAQIVKPAIKSRAHALFELFCSYEMPLKKTTKKHLLLEMLFLRMCGMGISHDSSSGSLARAQHSAALKENVNINKALLKESASPQESVPAHNLEQDEELLSSSFHALDQSDDGTRWQDFLTTIRACEDNLLVSIFEQAEFRSFRTKKVVIAYGQRSAFFEDHRNEKKSLWQAHLEKQFGSGVELAIEIDTALVSKQPLKKKSINPPINPVEQRKQLPQTEAIDISDKEQWKTTHLLLNHFGGTVRVIEDENE
jgi:DNA polymerase III subunit gamma/tau